MSRSLSLVSLPYNVIQSNVLPFCNVPSLGVLDRAVCSTENRLQLHEAFHGYVVDNGEVTCTKLELLSWLNKRHISMTKCNLDFMSVELDDMLPQLHAFKKVRALRINRVRPNLPVQEIFKAIDSLERFSMGATEDIYKSNADFNSGTVMVLAQRHTQLKSVYFARCLSVSDAGINALAKNCPALEEITFFNCENSSACIVELCKRCPQLRKVECVQGGPFTNDTLVKMSPFAKSLEELNISEYNKVGDAGILALAKGCPNLVKLNVQKSHLKDAGLYALAEHCPHLRVLNLMDTHVTAAGLVRFCEKNPLLESLALRNNEYEGELLLPAIAHWTHLHTLEVHNCNFNDAIWTQIAMQCRQLTHITSKNNGMTNESLLAFGTYSPQLTHLHINYWQNFTDGGLRVLTQGCRQLQSLEITRSTVLTEAGFRSIAENLRLLTHLEVYGCTLLSDVPLRAIVAQCEKLQKMTAVACLLVSKEFSAWKRG